MLFPTYEELVHLRAQASGLKPPFNQKVFSHHAGNILSTSRGRGIEFEEVREYVHGDDVRNIDWRVTARTNKPHLKLFREEKERNILLIIDQNTSMQFGTKTTFKSVQAARIAALLGWSSNLHGDRIGSLIYGAKHTSFTPPKRSRSSLWRTFKILCAPTEASNKNVSLHTILKQFSKRIPTGTLVFIISDFMIFDDNLERQLSLLKRRCDIITISVNDPADKNLFTVGNIKLISKNKHILINTNNQQALKKYAHLWKENRQKLAKITGRHHIKLIQTYTNADIYQDLVQALNMHQRAA